MATKPAKKIEQPTPLLYYFTVTFSGKGGYVVYNNCVRIIQKAQGGFLGCPSRWYENYGLLPNNPIPTPTLEKYPLSYGDEVAQILGNDYDFLPLLPEELKEILALAKAKGGELTLNEVFPVNN